MKIFQQTSDELIQMVNEWTPVLTSLSINTVQYFRNSQHRNIKQIVGHMIDSASNNTHRVIHMHYQESPVQFPDYANFGNNDRWIAIQNYNDEDWTNLVQLWKYSNLHFAHVILQADREKRNVIWHTATNHPVS